MIIRNFFHFALFTAVSTQCFAVQCLGAEPINAAKRFHKEYYNFYIQQPKKIKAIISPSLYRALEMERKCAVSQICAIDADPWLGAQDGGMEEKISYSLDKTLPKYAVVNIDYGFVVVSPIPIKRQRAQLILEEISGNKCWVVADLISPNGSSLLEIIQNMLGR